MHPACMEGRRVGDEIRRKMRRRGDQGMRTPFSDHYSFPSTSPPASVCRSLQNSPPSLSFHLICLLILHLFCSYVSSSLCSRLILLLFASCLLYLYLFSSWYLSIS